MTRVTFYRDSDGIIRGFEARDHSGFAEAGRDIVCAAVSALVIHTVNSIDRYTGDPAYESEREDQAVITFFIKDTPSEGAELLLRSLAGTLSDMTGDKSYSTFISVNFVEVQDYDEFKSSVLRS